MQIIESPVEMHGWALNARREGLRIGLVPTMGFLHQGHLSLVGLARQRCDKVVMSIYVNPTQFGPAEDLASYPRNLERDKALAEARGTDVLFVPADREIYAAGHCSLVEVQGPSRYLCGASRPGHFRGVATIVAKLFNLVQPHVAVFGQKDAQQLAVIQQMVRDLNMPVEIVAAPIVRETDGLAMSSRNAHLSPEERREARVLGWSLRAASQAFAAGERCAGRLVKIAEAEIRKSPLARVDYVSVVDREAMTPVEEVGDAGALLAVAVYMGRTRLIDNTVLFKGGVSQE
jgi:pantoate--beta-alanine ligase